MIAIDYQDRRPIYEQIVDRYEKLIIKGVLEPDTQMPSVRQMASDLSINPNTIQKAYAILESRGFIYPVKGRGNFVSGNAALFCGSSGLCCGASSFAAILLSPLFSCIIQLFSSEEGKAYEKKHLSADADAGAGCLELGGGGSARAGQ